MKSRTNRPTVPSIALVGSGHTPVPSYMMRTQPLFDEAMQQTTDFLTKCGFNFAP